MKPSFTFIGIVGFFASILTIYIFFSGNAYFKNIIHPISNPSTKDSSISLNDTTGNAGSQIISTGPRQNVKVTITNRINSNASQLPSKEQFTIPLEITNRFIAEKGTVVDKKHNLMWIECKFPKNTWYNALSYCKRLKYNGYSDWRLPTLDEMLTLSFEKNGQIIRTSFFPDIEQAVYWCYESCPIIDGKRRCLTEYSGNPTFSDVAVGLTLVFDPSKTYYEPYGKDVKHEFMAVRLLK